MTDKFNPLERWILKNNERVEKLTTARNNLADHFDEWINEQVEEAIKKVSNDYYINPKHPNNCIVFEKEEWPRGKGGFSWNRFSLAVWNTGYNYLADNSSQVGAGAIFRLGTKDEKVEFNTLFKKYFNEKKITSDAWTCVYSVDFPSIDQICALLEQNKEKELQDKILIIISELAGVSSTIEDFIKRKNLKADS